MIMATQILTITPIMIITTIMIMTMGMIAITTTIITRSITPMRTTRA